MTTNRKIVFTVTNDLCFDQRMDRICTALSDAGFEVTLIGRKRNASKGLSERPYDTKRISCFFESGKGFYLEYNFKLFFRLLRMKMDIIGAVDLDTVLPVYFVAKLKGKHWTFDAHEYFSELEEVVSRPWIHKVWQMVEAFVMRRVRHAYTISQGYASIFKSRYGADFKVIRNVPDKQEMNVDQGDSSQKAFIIYQGALNIGRGLPESILAMHSIEGLRLHIYGDGPIRIQLQRLIVTEKLNDKVKLYDALNPSELRKTTPKAYAGLTLFSATGMHHRYSLANRFFDYFHAGIPQVCMGYPEYSAFNKRFDIAVEIADLNPQSIASAINQLKENPDVYAKLKSNCAFASRENSWASESEKLIDLYSNL